MIKPAVLILALIPSIIGLSIGGYISLTTEEQAFDCFVYPGSSIMYVDKQSKDSNIFYIDKIEAVFIKGKYTTVQTESGAKTVIYTPRQCVVVQTPSVAI